MISLLMSALLLAPAPVVRAAPLPPRHPVHSSVHGQLRSAGLRTPIAGAKVYATSRRGADWTREATTGEDGSFVLIDLPTRDFLLTIVAAGHERLVQPTGAAYWSGRRTPVIYVQSTGAGRYRTIVAANREQHPSTYSARLSPREIASLPGSQGDPLRALQNLPGVARIPGGLGLLVMRGATPNQSQVFYGEHPIPRAFHFPGLASVVPGVALSGIQYTPGNFDSSYGNAVGGIVMMTPRSGRRDGVHGMAKLDVASAGTAFESRLGRGSFLIAAQRGYLDLALGVANRAGAGFPLPRYYDYQVVVEQPIGRGATATVRLIGASDSVGYPKGVGYTGFELSSTFHRADLSLRKRVDGWEFLLAPAVRFDRARVDGNVVIARKNDTVGLLRAEMTARPSQRLRITLGTDTQIDAYASRRTIVHGHFNPTEQITNSGLETRSGLYITPEITLRRLVIAPGVRLNAFTGGGGQAFSVDPRLIVRWTPHPRVVLSAGAGQYSQPNQRQLELGTSGFLLAGVAGTPIVPSGASGSGIAILPTAVNYLDAPLGFGPLGPIGVSQAAQLSGSIHVDILASLGVDATGFYRRVRDGLRPPPPGSDQSIDDTGSITYGIEALIRKQLTRRVYGWIAYTWMRSEQGVLTGESLTRRMVADFDQRHNFIAVLSVKLPRQWELGGRFRVVTGLPYTPFISGIHDADRTPTNDEQFTTQFISGVHNSARLAIFHQLDLRVDRTWVLHRCIVGAYLDVQNVYNRQNPEGVVYNKRYTGKTAAVGVPILPVFGVRVEY